MDALHDPEPRRGLLRGEAGGLEARPGPEDEDVVRDEQRLDQSFGRGAHGRQLTDGLGGEAVVAGISHSREQVGTDIQQRGEDTADEQRLS